MIKDLKFEFDLDDINVDTRFLLELTDYYDTRTSIEETPNIFTRRRTTTPTTTTTKATTITTTKTTTTTVALQVARQTHALRAQSVG